MKAVQQEVRVIVREGGHPRQVIWQGRTLTVLTILDEWRTGGRWWLDEPPRDCYLVQAGDLTAEVHHEDGPEGRWWLARIQD
ncbi:hypothetical protein DAETH_32920 (plasmid) [Deinococcus aetherius]|uniref:DUF6504 domain-containing protein n=1 Tax=Deinococcus aetherius TaxID=200252 RepID=A0ABM8AHP1_9DEIO|nr:DUF6504 family protein [Deinococcus aetherius]BDP43323.1 hypothetical protein DAETH_32920 [Deinococcus aetherius]